MQVYIRTTKRSINTRIEKHKRNCHLLQQEKSIVAEHALTNPDHKILFDDMEVLLNNQHYLTCLHREAIEIHKHKNYFNKKEESLRVKKSWYLALSVCKTKLYISKDIHFTNGP